MNSASNLLVLGATGQVGKLIAKYLRRSKANFSVGSRRKENLKELADQFGASRFIDLDDPRTFDQALKNYTPMSFWRLRAANTGAPDLFATTSR